MVTGPDEMLCSRARLPATAPPMEEAGLPFDPQRVIDAGHSTMRMA